MQGDRERCLDAGFDSYLAKPIHQRELAAILKPHEAKLPGPAQAHGFDVEPLHKICGGDEAFCRELAESFLESAPRCLAAIETALECDDSRLLAAQSHALRGISQTIGAHDLAACCAELEDATNRGDAKAAAVAAVQVESAWEQLRCALQQVVMTGIEK